MSVLIKVFGILFFLAIVSLFSSAIINNYYPQGLQNQYLKIFVNIGDFGWRYLFGLNVSRETISVQVFNSNISISGGTQ